MIDQKRALEWLRIPALFANVAPSGAPCAPTLGVAYDKCHCCDAEAVVIACIAENGAEISVSLPFEQAAELGLAIHNIIRKALDGEMPAPQLVTQQ